MAIVIVGIGSSDFLQTLGGLSSHITAGAPWCRCRHWWNRLCAAGERRLNLPRAGKTVLLVRDIAHQARFVTLDFRLSRRGRWFSRRWPPRTGDTSLRYRIKLEDLPCELDVLILISPDSELMPAHTQPLVIAVEAGCRGMVRGTSVWLPRPGGSRPGYVGRAPDSACGRSCLVWSSEAPPPLSARTDCGCPLRRAVRAVPWLPIVRCRQALSRDGAAKRIFVERSLAIVPAADYSR